MEIYGTTYPGGLALAGLTGLDHPKFGPDLTGWTRELISVVLGPSTGHLGWTTPAIRAQD